LQTAPSAFSNDANEAITLWGMSRHAGFDFSARNLTLAGALFNDAQTSAAKHQADCSKRGVLPDVAEDAAEEAEKPKIESC
jgi:hypothetical protein